MSRNNFQLSWLHKLYITMFIGIKNHKCKMRNIQKLIFFTGDILQDHKKIFEDVHSDFCNIQNILLKFQQWREKFPDSYYEAFISLCIPKLLNPLIRFQLIDWNPLKVYELKKIILITFSYLNPLVIRLTII